MNLFSIANKISKKQKYFYHIKSKEFEGDLIYPLSTLKDKNLKKYKESIKKYNDRKDQLTTKIEMLNCEWQDCINLSTLNPCKIFELVFLLKLKNWEHDIGREILKFPISVLKGKDFCLYDDEKDFKKSEAYSKLTINSYKELDSVPIETTKYFADMKEKNEDPLIFSYVSHILLKGELNIKNAEVVNQLIPSTVP